MSFRRRPSQRSNRGLGSNDESGDVIENPNAVGPFGAYRHTSEAVQVVDHEQDQAALHGRARERRSNDYHDVHPGWQNVGEFQHGLHSSISPNRHSFGPQGDQRQFPPSQERYFSVVAGSNEHVQMTSPERIQSTQPRQSYRHGIPLAPVSSVDQANQNAAQSEDGSHTPLVSHTSHQGSDSISGGAPLGKHETHRSATGALSAFNEVHGSSGSHLENYSEQTPIRFGHLFKRPLIRQWVLQDKVYRELDDREPSQFELFFDLVMVGVIHLLAEAAAEAATGLNVAKFILCFYPAWSVWSDVRAYINVSGTDDVWQRLYILLNMILLIGYTANANGIVIEKVDSSEQQSVEVATGDTESGLSVHRRALMMAVGTIIKRSSEGGGGGGDDSETQFVRQIGHTGYWFASGWRGAVSSTIAFYLVAKTLRLALYIIYGALLPKFRKALWLHGMAFLIITCVYLPIMFLNRPGIIVILLVVGVVVEIASRYLIAAALQLAHGHAKHKGHKTYMPAYSLPHLMERTTLFTILVIGEVIMNATYTAYSGEHGPQDMFWRASLGIVIAFMLMWLYFDSDSSRTFVHGLKRHWITSISFSNIHFPLCAALVLMGSSMAKLVKQEAVETRYMWFFSGSIATAMFCIGVIGILHKSLDRWGSSMFPRETRIALRFVMSAVFAVMPLLHHWKSVEFLGAFAAILALAVAFETFGKLGSVGREYDPVRAEQLRQARMGKDDEDDDGGGGDIALADINVAEKANRRRSKKVKIKSPSRRDSWHEYDDLTGAERGEDDVGIESELGRLEAKQLSSGERWAYVAT